jgi:heme peroxidase
MAPLPLATIRNDLKNLRVATLELDSLYGPPAPRVFPDLNKMLIGRVTSLQGTEKPSLRPMAKGDDNDLPREPRSPDFAHDRAARIGDPRNDENLIVAQLHLALLKAHNRLVDQGRTFAQARRLLRQHYQHIVVHDFLKRVADRRSWTAFWPTATGSTMPWPSCSSYPWSSPWPPIGSATP